MTTPAPSAPTDEPPTFPSTPPERIELSDGRALIRARPRWAADSARAINESLEHLAPWMAWAQEPATEAGLREVYAAAAAAWDARREFVFHLVEATADGGARVIGGAGLHGRLGRTGLEIGYWVHVDRAGQGLATAATRALTDAAFAIEGIERVRIQCEPANAASARVPEKLGFTLVGTVPGEDVCDGRAVQQWVVERERWVAGLRR